MSREKSGEKMPTEVEKRPKSLDIRANEWLFKSVE